MFFEILKIAMWFNPLIYVYQHRNDAQNEHEINQTFIEIHCDALYFVGQEMNEINSPV